MPVRVLITPLPIFLSSAAVRKCSGVACIMNTSWILHLLYTMILTHLSDSFSISLQVKDARRRRQAETWSCQAVAKQETLTRSTLLTRVLTGLNIGLISTFIQPDRSRALESDEFEEIFEEQAIGIELQDVRYKGSYRVIIKRVFEGGAASTRPRMKSNLVLVSANGKDLERENAVAAKEIIKTSSRPITLVFRDADMFTELLTSDRGQSAYRSDDATLSFQPVTTRVAPEGTGQEEQLLKVLSSTKSSSCESCKGARRGDLLEIEYTGRLQDGKVFDGSNIKVNGREVVGRGGDTSLFFVLGKQPTGQFPPGWDVMLVGMCVGESRVISVPPLLGYGAQGLPRRGVPPNSTLVYDVKLVGVNGVNMCTS